MPVVGPDDSTDSQRFLQGFPSGSSSHRLVIKDAVGGSLLKTISVHDKTKQVCERSLFVFALQSNFRQMVILLVEWRWFDRFILFCIAVNSLLLGIFQYRAQEFEDHYWLNELIDDPGWADHVLWGIFALESILKIIAWGFVLDKHSFLRDPWNVLDFVVVVSGLLERCGLGGDVKFLRLFRLLRPLRSLNAAPQMKILVNTALSSILRLGNVCVLGAFLFTVFGIIGIQLLNNVFYRQCRATPNPELIGGCWQWTSAGDERLCGGNYMCEESGGYCGGHEADSTYGPHFDGGRRGIPWCEGSEPRKLFPETDFVHFDHIGGAFLLIFQAMTLEGWTDLMYMVEDSYNVYFAVFFFVAIAIFTNFFMLNVALAVVDEVQDSFTEQANEEKKLLDSVEEEKARNSQEAWPSELQALDEDPEAEGDSKRSLWSEGEWQPRDSRLWYQSRVVKWCFELAISELFGNFIMLAIAGNVVNMCLSRFSLDDNFGWYRCDMAIEILEIIFLAIFIVEMGIMIVALGPCGYVKNPITCFDGFVVLGSIAELVVSQVSADDGGGGLSVLRTFRLFRVMNKLASKWTKLRVLLKAMFETGKALKDWLVLFFLVLYIFTLMNMHAFAKQFRFEDVDALDPLYTESIDAGDPWCPDPHRPWQQPQHFRQGCIPRAHFDTFTWGIVTVFQVMSGENWNTIMYAGMRASERWTGTWSIPPTVISAGLFVIMILFGQTLFMSLFLSMLISKFDDVQDEVEGQEREAMKKNMFKSTSAMSIASVVSKMSVISPKPKAKVTRVKNLAASEDRREPKATASPEPTTEEDSSNNNNSNGHTGLRWEFSGDLLLPPTAASATRSTACTSSPSSSQGQMERVEGDDAGGCQAVAGDDGKAGHLCLDTTVVVPRDPSPEASESEPNCAATPPPDKTVTTTLPGQLPYTPPMDEKKAAEDGHEGLAEGGKEPASEGNHGGVSFSTQKIEVRPRKSTGNRRQHSEDTTLEEEEDEDNDEEEEDENSPGPSKEAWFAPQRWPAGYALLCLREENCLRRACTWLLEKKVTFHDEKIAVFDNFILACIILATLCMMMNTPLSNPHTVSTQVVRVADTVFAYIFIIEMAIKLIAYGLLPFWDTKDTKSYLSSRWNILDGIVVMVSIVDLLPISGGPGFLRVLRILRTFRPLRVITKMKGLQVVVETVFQSIGDLFSLAIASLLFLLIFALIFVVNLKGMLYQCNGDSVGFLGANFGHLGDNFVTPLCLSTDIRDSSIANGNFSEESGLFTERSCTTTPNTVSWKRPSADTPICLARCDPTRDKHDTHPGIEALCPPKYTSVWELPSACEDASVSPSPYLTEVDKGLLLEKEELIGRPYIEAMQRTLVVPCGGYTSVDGEVVASATGVSCRSNFCGAAEETPTEECQTECREHKFFCKDCKLDSDSSECKACLRECEAACMCEDFCTPLIKDAALCHEQGGSWEPVLSQNFNNILNAILTLFEIATTEGWVDVMYAASDVVGVYRQPVRDASHGLYVFLFPLWIILSFMFLLNLVVGVIVDNFMDAREGGPDGEPPAPLMVTEGQDKWFYDAQKKWIMSRKTLHSKAFFFDLTKLHLLPRWRRSVYKLVSHKAFENFIMGCICCNTIVMGAMVFPEPTDWWYEFQEIANRVFAAIFTLEAILKIAALRSNYLLDPWNKFDFVCVLASLIGIAVGQGAFSSVIRILRIARLIRLLRFLKELNRLFKCLFRSIPKLFNVLMILILFLILFSILGTSLFGTAKYGETFNEHGNFQNFGRGFVTLLRASTGEAWNEIMHDLAKDERDWFRQGDWCTPQSMWRDVVQDEHVWDVLEAKCLIKSPNACGGSWNPMPAFFWVAFTIVTTIMMLNLVVAVILEGYEEGRQTSAEDDIDACVEIWKKYDPDHKMAVPFEAGMRFILEVERVLRVKSKEDSGETAESTMDRDLTALSGATDPVELSKRLRLKKGDRGKWQLHVTSDNQITFESAARQILRLNSVDNPNETQVRRMQEKVSKQASASAALHDEQALEDELMGKLMNEKERKQLKLLERAFTPGNSVESQAQDLLSNIAAMKLQRKFRDRKAARVAAQARGEAAGDDAASPRL